MSIAEWLTKAGCPDKWLATMELLLYHIAHDGLEDKYIRALGAEFTTKEEEAHILSDVLFRCKALMEEGITTNWKSEYQ